MSWSGSLYTGTAGNDSVAGTPGNGSWTVEGLGGDDTLTGSPGVNFLRGGPGDDALQGQGIIYADYSQNGASQPIDVTRVGGSDGLGGSDTFSLTVANVTGGAGDDWIDYSAPGLAGQLSGRDGNDTILAAGATIVDGGMGDDLLAVGLGGHVFGGFGSDTVGVNVSSPTSFIYAANNTLTPTAGSPIYLYDAEFIWTTSGIAPLVIGRTYVVCYATGTRILTAGGAVEVQDLRPGDQVISARDGAARALRWVGQRQVDLRAAGSAASLPVRIREGALGPGLPARDLVVSRRHALLLDGVLVPAECLLDGAWITLDRDMPEVTWWHLDLGAHDCVLAEGVAAESWRDAGNRAFFANAAGAPAAVPDEPCAEVVEDGPRLAAIRAHLVAARRRAA